MALDHHSETISHFIGLFHMQAEEARLKEAYAAFAAALDKAADLSDLVASGIIFKSKYVLEGFMPGFSYLDRPEPVGDVPAFFTAHLTTFAGPAFVPGVGAATAAAAELANLGPQTPIALFGMDPASSTASVTLQLNTAQDADSFGAVTVSAEALAIADTKTIKEAEAVIKALTPVKFEGPVEGDQSNIEFAQNTLAAIQDAAPAELDGVEVFMATGEAATNTVVVDGEEVEALPDHSELLPAFLQPVEEDEEPGDEDEEPEVVRGDGDDGLEDGTDGDVEVDGMSPHVGRILSHVETARAAAEAGDDAEEPEVEDPSGLGETAGFTLSDPVEPEEEADNPMDVDPGHEIVTGGNQVVNEASLVSNWIDAPHIAVMEDVVSVQAVSQINVIVDQDTVPTDVSSQTSNAVNAARIEATETAAPDAPGLPGVQPNWFVSRIEGDLVAVNWVVQHNYVMDTDSVRVEVTGNDFSLITGSNTAVNVAGIFEFGFRFDLIVVGGNLIDMTLVTQSNIIIDNDVVTTDGALPTTLSTSDNLALNLASINEQGVDTFTDLQGGMGDVADTLADHDASTLPAAARGIGDLNEQAAVRVLQVDGDLVTVNSIEQRNIVGDSDQVELAMQDFLLEQTDQPVSVTAGSNAAMNLATVVNVGVDSQIQVGGDTYSDALLYQAEFIDSSADPTGVGITALANEAVAFLAEGLIDDDSPLGEDDLMFEPGLDGGGASTGDILTTLLA